MGVSRRILLSRDHPRLRATTTPAPSSTPATLGHAGTGVAAVFGSETAAAAPGCAPGCTPPDEPTLAAATVASFGAALARVLPNLHTYVPPRSLLLGQVSTAPVWPYVGTAALQALFYVTALLAASSLAFTRRDFA